MPLPTRDTRALANYSRAGLPGRGAGVGRGLGVTAGLAVGVGRAVAVAVAVGVTVTVAVGVARGLIVGVAVGVIVGVGVKVAVGDAQGVPCPWHQVMLTVSTRQPSLDSPVSLAIRQRSLPRV